MSLVHFETRAYETNYHGQGGDPETLRSTWALVRMNSYVMCYSLYLYRADGSGRRITVRFPHWRTEWPEKNPRE